MLSLRIFTCTFSVCLIVLAADADLASAQNFPSKPIRVVTGDVGAAPDIALRLIAPGLVATLGQPVIIDNRGGGSGAIATQTVSKSPPDGYTLLLYASALWLSPLMKQVPWDPIKDFSPVSLLGSAPNILVVHPSLPVKSVKDLMALAKARPGALNYGSGGSGGSPHLAAELFKSMAGVDLVRIVYKGGGAAVNDLVAGHIHVMFASAGSAMAFINARRLKAIAVTSTKPSALAPGLPTVADSGLPGFVSLGMFPLFAPSGTPAAVINRVQRDFSQVVNSPDNKEKLLGAGVESVGGTPEDLAALVKSEIAMWGKVIKAAGIRE